MVQGNLRPHPKCMHLSHKHRVLSRSCHSAGADGMEIPLDDAKASTADDLPSRPLVVALVGPVEPVSSGTCGSVEPEGTVTWMRIRK